jgi:malonyl-CoA decarboxylase
MSGFLTGLFESFRRRRADMRFLCRHLLSERGEASQTVLAQEIIDAYSAMSAERRLDFFEMLSHEFSPDGDRIRAAAAAFEKSRSPEDLAALSAAVEAPRQELFRRINTASRGTETLVALRAHLLQASRNNGRHFNELDADLKHLFRSWFNRGFLRLERISWQSPASVLEKLIRYESVHEINGWPDLRRRLESDRRCFAFFHSALANEPIIFVEVALCDRLVGELDPLLDVNAPVLEPRKMDTAIFYSINNCQDGLRNIPMGNFLIKQVVSELAVEFPNIRTYSTLSPLPRFSRALQDRENKDGFTSRRLSRLLSDFGRQLSAAAGCRDVVDAFFTLLARPLNHRKILTEPLQRLALAYLTCAHRDGKLYDAVATFHLSNGARLERINPFGNLRPYGLEASLGVTANYRYISAEVEENHERFVRAGKIRISSPLFHEYKMVTEAWEPDRAEAAS